MTAAAGHVSHGPWTVTLEWPNENIDIRSERKLKDAMSYVFCPHDGTPSWGHALSPTFRSVFDSRGALIFFAHDLNNGLVDEMFATDECVKALSRCRGVTAADARQFALLVAMYDGLRTEAA